MQTLLYVTSSAAVADPSDPREQEADATANITDRRNKDLSIVWDAGDWQSVCKM
jgi:hypothetical protein